MRKQQKGKKGAVNNYYTRNQAIKKLRLNLVDFRRLCILKGIFPREPTNVKKLTGSTEPKTFYLAKDIHFLAHEPLLRRFREFKIFTKRLRKAMGRKEYSVAAHLRHNKPVYTLDHLIRERYPTFIDAVRDLDDALCLLFLFSKLPMSSSLDAATIERCSRLCAEFQNYCVMTNALRKVFLSIKGIYYQAEIHGQLVTWITPYQFTPKVPSDIDLRVMLTFVEFYETLLGFVNFKLYRDENLHYPPNINKSKDGLSAITSRHLSVTAASMIASTAKASVVQETVNLNAVKESEERISTLRSKFAYLEGSVTETEIEADSKAEPKASAPTKLFVPEEVQLDEFPENKALLESSQEVALADIKQQENELTKFKKLFSGCVFFLNRETPRESLEFVIKAFGGKVGWDCAAADGSPFPEDHKSITHHIVDRPSVQKVHMNRQYIQPQWVYDCVNFKKLFPTAQYAPGSELPPHFSPFVVEQEGDYIPPELLEIRGEAKKVKAGEEEEGEEGEEPQDEEEEEPEEGVMEKELEEEDAEEEEEEEEKEEGEDAIDSDDEEAIYQRELEAEAAGIPFSSFKSKINKSKPKASEVKKKQEEKEQKQMAKIMMKKKDRRLFEKVTKAQSKKKHYVERMQKKRERIDEQKQPDSKKQRVK